MKFKTKEELKEFDREQHGLYVPYYKGWNDALNSAFEFFAERVLMFQSYYLKPIEFYNEIYKNEYDDCKNVEEFIEKFCLMGNFKSDYQVWLFNYCFGDVIE